jgi:hypothetical protein
MLAAAHRLDYSKMTRQGVRTRIDSSLATAAVDKSCGGRNPLTRQQPMRDDEPHSHRCPDIL